MEVELGVANAWAFGVKESGTDSVCIVVGPNGQGFDTSSVLHDSERGKAGAWSTRALKVNGVNWPKTVFGTVSNEALEGVQGVLEREEWCSFVLGPFVVGEGFDGATGDFVTG